MSLVSLLIATYARLFSGRWYNVRVVMKASSLMSKALVPPSGPMLIVRLGKPEPGTQSVQVPSVEKVPLPDRLPENVMLNVSALSGTRERADRYKWKEESHYTPEFRRSLAHL